jgi:ribonucleoside-diphosphate reductase alpha chain
MRHRPVGLGIMGFQDALYKLRTSYGSDAAVEFADRSMEALSYYAIEASSDLARVRGSYSSFEGSLWSRGIMPIDSLAALRIRAARSFWTATSAPASTGTRYAPK